jgi:hypothetical protein
MRLQHVSPLPFGQNGESVAALQHNLPEAAVRNGLKGRNPNRPFAAGVFDVSVAGQNGHLILQDNPSDIVLTTTANTLTQTRRFTG